MRKNKSKGQYGQCAATFNILDWLPTEDEISYRTIAAIRDYVLLLTCHKAGATVKDILHGMTHVHGKYNVPSPKTFYCWIKKLKMDVLN